MTTDQRDAQSPNSQAAVGGARRLLREQRAVGTLMRVSHMIARDLDLDALLGPSMSAAASAVSAEACSSLLQDAQTSESYFRPTDADHTGGFAQSRLPIDDHGIAGWSATRGRCSCATPSRTRGSTRPTTR